MSETGNRSHVPHSSRGPQFETELRVYSFQPVELNENKFLFCFLYDVKRKLIEPPFIISC